VELYLHSPKTPSWRGTQLSTGTTSALSFTYHTTCAPVFTTREPCKWEFPRLVTNSRPPFTGACPACLYGHSTNVTNQLYGTKMYGPPRRGYTELKVKVNFRPAATFRLLKWCVTRTVHTANFNNLLKLQLKSWSLQFIFNYNVGLMGQET
jgi:hypothetical protein